MFSPKVIDPPSTRSSSLLRASPIESMASTDQAINPLRTHKRISWRNWLLNNQPLQRDQSSTSKQKPSGSRFSPRFLRFSRKSTNRPESTALTSFSPIHTAYFSSSSDRICSTGSCTGILTDHSSDFSSPPPLDHQQPRLFDRQLSAPDSSPCATNTTSKPSDTTKTVWSPTTSGDKSLSDKRQPALLVEEEAYSDSLASCIDLFVDTRQHNQSSIDSPSCLVTSSSPPLSHSLSSPPTQLSSNGSTNDDGGAGIYQEPCDAPDYSSTEMLNFVMSMASIDSNPTRICSPLKRPTSSRNDSGIAEMIPTPATTSNCDNLTDSSLLSTASNGKYSSMSSQSSGIGTDSSTINNIRVYPTTPAGSIPNHRKAVVTSSPPLPHHRGLDSSVAPSTTTTTTAFKRHNAVDCTSVATSPPPPAILGSIAPRGSASISHHPSSPFSRVTRPIDFEEEEEDIKLDTTVPTSLSSESTNMATPTPSTTSVTANNHFHDNSSLVTASGDTVVNGNASKTSSDPHQNVTYEEAWDVKMVREFGFNLTQLTGRPKVNDQATPSSPSKPLRPSDRNSLDRPTSVQHPRSHDNKLFDLTSPPGHNGIVESNQPGKTDKQRLTDSNSEYDYAYNNSWSRGVQLNLDLAMNLDHDKIDKSTSPPRDRRSTIQLGQHHDHFVARRIPGGSGSSTDSSFETHPTQPAIRTTPPHRSLAQQSPRHVANKIAEGLSHGSPIHSLAGHQVHNTPSTPTPSASGLVLVQNPTFVPSSSAATAMPSTIATGHRATNGKSSSRSSNGRHPLDDQVWFHGALTRSEAERLLEGSPDGSFLIRHSQTCRHDYSLSIKHRSNNMHMKISRSPNNTGQFILGEHSQPYASVANMIQYYLHHPLPVRGADSTITLLHPIGKDRRTGR